ncbi:MAG TPA: hypothetical protein VFM54_12000 [Micromonosporaceae bacterium]|nr:hypothetical protein [Micromonosporaceae bacterium]
MTDALLVLVILVFFALCALYVRFCDRVIAHGEPVAAVDEKSEVVR